MSTVFVRSTLVLAMLFGLVFAVGMMVTVFLGLPVCVPIGLALGVVALQFAIGPAILEWIFKIEWVDPEDLSPALADFLRRVCAERGIPMPRVGLIDDGNPNAFTFGHSPGDARLLVTQGIMDLLTLEEQQAVVAHELGHIAHWDFVVMTIAGTVPLILYVLAQATMRAGEAGEDTPLAVLGVVGLGAYVAYFVSQYIVLLLSRVREYFADEFSASVTGDPDQLASALVKIAYGLARASEEAPAEKEEELPQAKPEQRPTIVQSLFGFRSRKKATAADERAKRAKKRDQRMFAARPFGIFDPKMAQSLALVDASAGQVSLEGMTSAMKWDLWNPWSIWFEFTSSHPLPAKRIRALEQQASAIGRPSQYTFRKEQPESYWDEFLFDLGVTLLPLIGVVVGAIAAGLATGYAVFLLYPLIVGVFWFVKLRRVYPQRFDEERTVSSLVSEVEVSPSRPIPCTIKGKIIGRGVPGLFYSEDLVLQDDTGFIILDYRQPIGFLETLFGLLKAGDLIGKSGEVRGWYRRAPGPVFELRQMTLKDGGKVTSYYYPFRPIWNYLLLAFGLPLGLWYLLFT